MADDRCELLCINLPRVEEIRSRLEGEPAADAAARAKAFSDSTRMLLALALRDGEELCVCDLSWIAKKPDKGVSHHLRALRAGGMARSRREHKLVFYSLTERGLTLLDALLEARSATTP